MYYMSPRSGIASRSRHVHFRVDVHMHFARLQMKVWKEEAAGDTGRGPDPQPSSFELNTFLLCQ